MGTKNITLAIDEDLLDKVRVIAAMEKTTVNALVRGFLQELAGKRDRTAKIRQRLVERSRTARGVIGTGPSTREGVNGR